MTLIGTEVPRTEDLLLLTGRGNYVADVKRPGQLWARVVRSPVAHARLRAVGVEAARAMPGVVDIVTSVDIPDVRIPIRLQFAETPEANRVLQPPLARDLVRYVGEPVAVVVADSPYAAEDAAELVELDFEELPAVVDTLAATESEPLHTEFGSNVVNRIPFVYGADVDGLFERADIVVSDRLRIQRHTAIPMETRGLVAEVVDGRLTVWGVAKAKHFTRTALARMLDLPESEIRCIEGDVGGGFGVRGEFYPEDFLIPWLAVRLQRPVKWIEDRYEHFVATNHSREQVHDIEIAAASDGTLLAFRDRFWADFGSYVRTQGILLALVTSLELVGPYRWQGFDIQAGAVLTNKTPSGTYRGPGMTEATFVRERMLDRVAREVGLDPVELRRRNLIPLDSMPYRFDFAGGVPPLVYDGGDFPKLFEESLAYAGYDGLRAEYGEDVGIGVASYVEMGGVGPFETARIVAEDDGTYTAHVGVASVGQGLRTVLAQIAAEGLGVELDRVRISHHDTDVVPEGFGTFASRSTVLAGNAIALAVADLRASGGREGNGTFEKETPTWSFGTQVSVVRVDRDTGRVTPLRHTVAFDVGRAVNPLLLRGQLAGAAAQGIAGALYEELRYDADGQPLSTSFVDYLMPTLAELPEIDALPLEYPNQSNPLGIKGGGEGGVTGAPEAVANAVADALGDMGARVNALPLTPENVRALIRGDDA
jgi:carbon-monoxide dehydrogenase large subunit